MAFKQIHAEEIRPDFGQTGMAEHPGREIPNVVRNDDGGLGYNRRSNDMGILPLHHRSVILLFIRNKYDVAGTLAIPMGKIEYRRGEMEKGR